MGPMRYPMTVSSSPKRATSTATRLCPCCGSSLFMYLLTAASIQRRGMRDSSFPSGNSPRTLARKRLFGRNVIPLYSNESGVMDGRYLRSRFLDFAVPTRGLRMVFPGLMRDLTDDG